MEYFLFKDKLSAATALLRVVEANPENYVARLITRPEGTCMVKDEITGSLISTGTRSKNYISGTKLLKTDGK